MKKHITNKFSKTMDTSEQKLQMLELNRLCSSLTAIIKRSWRKEFKYLLIDRSAKKDTTDYYERGIASIIIGSQSNKFNKIIDNIIDHINRYRKPTPSSDNIYQSSLYKVAQLIYPYLKSSMEYLKLYATNDHAPLFFSSDRNPVKPGSWKQSDLVYKNSAQRHNLHDCQTISMTMTQDDTPTFTKKLEESFADLQDKINPQWRMTTLIPDEETDVSKISRCLNDQVIKTFIHLIDMSALRTEISESFKRALSFYLQSYRTYLTTLLNTSAGLTIHFTDKLQDNIALSGYVCRLGLSTETQTESLRANESCGLFRVAKLFDIETEKLLAAPLSPSIQLTQQ